MDGVPDVEAQIRAAQERGDFDDLPGKGKPLDLPEVHDPDWWVKSYIRREGIDTSVLVHPTVALRREADCTTAAPRGSARDMVMRALPLLQPLNVPPTSVGSPYRPLSDWPPL